MAEVGDIRVAAYMADGFLSADSGYAATLRGLGADGLGVVLVAVLPGEAAGQVTGAEGGRVVGTIMLQPWPHAGQVVGSPGGAEIRALAVDPRARGRGVGAELLRHLLERAAGLGIRDLVLCTLPEMSAAHLLYERAGFARRPERDWSPAPDEKLLVYGMRLDGGSALS